MPDHQGFESFHQPLSQAKGFTVTDAFATARFTESLRLEPASGTVRVVKKHRLSDDAEKERRLPEKHENPLPAELANLKWLWHEIEEEERAHRQPKSWEDFLLADTDGYYSPPPGKDKKLIETYSKRNDGNVEELIHGTGGLGHSCEGLPEELFPWTIAFSETGCEVLRWFQSIGFVHGDIRPKNFEYRFDDVTSSVPRFFLTGFARSRTVKHRDERIDGRWCSTDAYMPPEVNRQFLSDKYHGRGTERPSEWGAPGWGLEADLWCFGMSLLRVLRVLCPNCMGDLLPAWMFRLRLKELCVDDYAGFGGEAYYEHTPMPHEDGWGRDTADRQTRSEKWYYRLSRLLQSPLICPEIRMLLTELPEGRPTAKTLRASRFSHRASDDAWADLKRGLRKGMDPGRWGKGTFSKIQQSFDAKITQNDEHYMRCLEEDDKKEAKEQEKAERLRELDEMKHKQVLDWICLEDMMEPRKPFSPYHDDEDDLDQHRRRRGRGADTNEGPGPRGRGGGGGDPYRDYERPGKSHAAAGQSYQTEDRERRSGRHPSPAERDVSPPPRVKKRHDSHDLGRGEDGSGHRSSGRRRHDDDPERGRYDDDPPDRKRDSRSRRRRGSKEYESRGEGTRRDRSRRGSGAERDEDDRRRRDDKKRSKSKKTRDDDFDPDWRPAVPDAPSALPEDRRPPPPPPAEEGVNFHYVRAQTEPSRPPPPPVGPHYDSPDPYEEEDRRRKSKRREERNSSRWREDEEPPAVTSRRFIVRDTHDGRRTVEVPIDDDYHHHHHDHDRSPDRERSSSHHHHHTERTPAEEMDLINKELRRRDKEKRRKERERGGEKYYPRDRRDDSGGEEVIVTRRTFTLDPIPTGAKVTREVLVDNGGSRLHSSSHREHRGGPPARSPTWPTRREDERELRRTREKATTTDATRRGEDDWEKVYRDQMREARRVEENAERASRDAGVSSNRVHRTVHRSRTGGVSDLPPIRGIDPLANIRDPLDRGLSHTDRYYPR